MVFARRITSTAERLGLLTLLVCAAIRADVVTIVTTPPSLQLGDQYQLVFVTSGARLNKGAHRETL